MRTAFIPDLTLLLAVAALLTCSSEQPSTAPSDQRDELSPRGSIAGYVSDTRGNPLEDVLVSIDSGKGTPDMSNAHGFFTVEEVLEGDYHLRFSHHEYEPCSTEVRLSMGADTVLEDTTTLIYRFYMVAGTLSHDDAPVKGAGVSLANYPVSTLTDENGSYFLEGIPKADSVRLICAKEGVGFTVHTVGPDELLDDDTTHVSAVSLDRTGATVTGTVYDPDGVEMPWTVVKALGGGIRDRTDAAGHYCLDNLPTGEPRLRITVASTDSSLVGAITGLSLTEGAVSTGMDIHLKRRGEMVNGMSLTAEDLLVIDTVSTVRAAVYPTTDLTTTIAYYVWTWGDSSEATDEPRRTFGLADAAERVDIAVRAANTDDELSATAAFSIIRIDSKPLIADIGARTDPTRPYRNSLCVNVREPVSFMVDIRDPVGGIDSTWWRFGDGNSRETAGLFDAPGRHAYLTADTHWAVVEARDCEGQTVRDSVLVDVNTPPVFVEGQVYRSGAAVDHPYRFNPIVEDADGDEVSVALLSRAEGMTLTGDTIAWTPDTADTGAHIVALRCTDGRGGADTASWTVTVTLKPADNPDLDSIALSSGSLSPAFDPSTAEYRVTVRPDVAYFRVKPIPADMNATLTVDGNPLSPGQYSPYRGLEPGAADTVAIVVTAQNGTTSSSYRIIVTRDLGANAILSSLAPSHGRLQPVFDPHVFAYVDSVDHGINYLSLTPTSADPNATIRVNGALVPSGGRSEAYRLRTDPDTLEITVTAENDTTTLIYTVEVFHRPSDDAGLLNLLLTTGQLDPPFHPDTLDYAASVPHTVHTVRAKPVVSDSLATVTVDGDTVASGTFSDTTVLHGGENTLEIVVTAEDGATERTYTVTIPPEPGTSADLLSLETSGSISPGFANATTEYVDTVPHEVSVYTVTAVAEDPAATLVVEGDTVASGASRDIDLHSGTVAINVAVYAEDGETANTFTIFVTRESDVALSALTLSDGELTPSFRPESTAYACTVTNEVAGLRVAPTARSAGIVELTINGASATSGVMSPEIALDVGGNTIEVRVEGVDGFSSRLYAIAVYREASDNAHLSNLQVSRGTLRPAFHPDTLAYRDTIDVEASSIRVRPTREHPDATITVNGTTVSSGSNSDPIPMDYGENTITVTVTAGDGTTQETYAITVVREPNAIVALTSLAIDQGSLSPAFDNADTVYEVYVPNEVDSLRVTPTAEEPRAEITVNATIVPSGTASDPVALQVGENTITVVVTAMDGVTTRTFTITVDRHEPTTTYEMGLHVTDADTLRKSESPYHFTQSILVDSGASLLIEPGTVLEMDSNVSITINGLLVARGTETDSIRFRAYDSRYPWGTLLFSDQSMDATYDVDSQYTGGCVMEYCVVAYGGESARPGALCIESSNPFMARSRVQYSAWHGVRLDGGEPLFSSCTFGANASDGLHAANGATPTILHCVTERNGARGLVLHDGGQLRGCTATRNQQVGLELDHGAVAHECRAEDNQLAGMRVDRSCIVNCVAAGNGGGGVRSGGGCEVESCAVIANNATGVWMKGGRLILRGSLVHANTAPSYAGIRAGAHTGDSITNNTVAGNLCTDSAGVTAAVRTGPYNGQLSHNTFINNTADHILENTAAQGNPVDATNNYWGTTSETEIKQAIYDYFDDGNLSVVDFEPFLTTPDPSCPDTTWSPLP